MAELPTGTITLLFTDIEGSTRLWERYPHMMPAAIDRHDTILRETIEANGGVVFRTVGDAFCAAFAGAQGALHAALYAQRTLHFEPWDALGLPHVAEETRHIPPLRVRMGLHTSSVDLRGGEYSGPPLNRVARLMAAGHGGQTLVCQDTSEMVRDILPPGVSLRDMGEHRLKDLRRPLRIFQLDIDGLPADFPPLKTLTLAEKPGPGVAAFHQAKLPGMPSVDYDALWRSEKERERQRKSKKGRKKKEDGGGLF